MVHALHRTLTFMFTDLEGSTRLWDRFPEAMADALSRHDSILRAAIEASARTRGQDDRRWDDGGVRERGRRHDRRALLPSSVSPRRPWGETGPLRVRMGVHSGQAEQRGDDFFGPDGEPDGPDHGCRPRRTGPALGVGRRPGTRALPPGADLMDLGEHRLKDLGRPEHLFQLVHPNLPSTFPPLVDRAFQRRADRPGPRDSSGASMSSRRSWTGWRMDRSAC